MTFGNSLEIELLRKKYRKKIQISFMNFPCGRKSVNSVTNKIWNLSNFQPSNFTTEQTGKSFCVCVCKIDIFILCFDFIQTNFTIEFYNSMQYSSPNHCIITKLSYPTCLDSVKDWKYFFFILFTLSYVHPSNIFCMWKLYTPRKSILVWESQKKIFTRKKMKIQWKSEWKMFKTIKKWKKCVECVAWCDN